MAWDPKSALWLTNTNCRAQWPKITLQASTPCPVQYGLDIAYKASAEKMPIQIAAMFEKAQAAGRNLDRSHHEKIPQSEKACKNLDFYTELKKWRPNS